MTIPLTPTQQPRRPGPGPRHPFIHLHLHLHLHLHHHLHRYLLPALAACLVAVLAPPAAAQQRVRIGLMGPITGPQAAYGIDHRNGATLALREINARGLKVAGKPVLLELDVQDDLADPRQGVQVAQMLVDKGVKFVLGPYNSGVAMPVSRVLSEAGALMFTVGSNPKITRQGHANVFRIATPDDELGLRMADYAAQELKARTVAVINDRTAYGQGLAHEFSQRAQTLGLRMVARAFTSDKATDFSAILTQVRAAQPDAVFYGGYSAQAGPLLRQMRALGLKAPLLGGDALCSTETAVLSQLETGLDVHCTQGGAIMNGSPAGRQFIQRYREAFQREPLSTYAVAFYDTAQMLAEAMRATGSTDPAKVRDHIARGSYQGVGGVYAYDEKHDLRASAVAVYGFKGKELVPLKSY